MKQARKDKMLADAIMLLKNDKLRGFRIDIETDSTVAGNAEQEKEQRIQFVEGVTKFIETAGQVTAQVPEFAPLAAKMLQFAVRGFRVGRDLETAIEEFSEKAEQHAKDQAANPKPDPEMQKAQAEIERVKIENQGEQYNNQANMQIKSMEVRMKEMEIQIAQIKAGAEVEANRLEAEKQQRDNHFETLKHERDKERTELEHKRALELGEHQHKIKMSESSKSNGAAH